MPAYKCSIAREHVHLTTAVFRCKRVYARALGVVPRVYASGIYSRHTPAQSRMFLRLLCACAAAGGVLLLGGLCWHMHAVQRRSILLAETLRECRQA